MGVFKYLLPVHLSLIQNDFYCFYSVLFLLELQLQQSEQLVLSRSEQPIVV
jgi:hypothetical protein